MKCSLCGQDRERMYWQRLFPYIVLCEDCFKRPDHAASQSERVSIAHLIWEARHESRDKAKDIHDGFKGTGVKAKIERRKHP